MTAPTIEDDLAALIAAIEAGPTPGEWATGNTDPFLFGGKRGNGTEPIGFVYGPSFPERSKVGLRAIANARYIAAASPARIARLIAALKEARAELSREQPARVGLTEELIARLVLQTVYEGDASTPHREAWAAEIGIPFARAIERAHNIPAAQEGK